jgi:protein TonB
MWGSLGAIPVQRLADQNIPDHSTMAPLSIVGSLPGGTSAAEENRVLGPIFRSVPIVLPRIAIPQRVRVSQGVSQSLALSKVPPVYPRDARRTRVQGAVLLHILISKTGEVESVELVSGPEMLAPAAIEAVR